MTRRIRVRAIKRREVDEDKLALAFLLLAKTLHEQAATDEAADQGPTEAALTDPTPAPEAT